MIVLDETVRDLPDLKRNSLGQMVRQVAAPVVMLLGPTSRPLLPGHQRTR